MFGVSMMKRAGISVLETISPSSSVAFPDGGSWRIEIPSVEGVKATEAVFRASDEYDVPVHRISQGSGVFMLTDAEIRDMLQACVERGVELCLFARPGANWDIGAARDSAAGSMSARNRGISQLAAAIADVERAVDLGVRSVLIADEGLLWTLNSLRAAGHLPADLQFKISVMAGPTNPAAFRLQGLLGADTINVPSDLTIQQLAEIRTNGEATIDFYVEAADNIGGFVRYHEIGELVRVAAPIYLKFGLRNAPDVYPSGQQLESVVLSSSRERVRRARLGLDALGRSGCELRMSSVGQREQPSVPHFPAD